MRKLLMFSGAVALASGSILAVVPGHSHAARIVDGPEVHWKFSVWGKRRSFTEGIEYVSKNVGERTGGKFRIEIFYEGQLSKSTENLEGVASGAFEGAVVCALYHPEKNKPLNVLDLPFLPLNNLDIMRKVHDAIYAHPLSQEVFNQWNAVLYISTVLPQFEFMGRGAAPKSTADFEGRRVRARGSLGRAVEMLGATTSWMPVPQAKSALDSDAVDTISLPYSYAFAAYGIDESADWVTTNMKLGTANCPVVFNRQAYDALPLRYKQLLEDLKPGAYTAMRRSYAEQDIDNEERWRAGSRIEMVEFSESEMEKFRRIAGRPIWNAWVDENEGEIPARELLQIVLDTALRLVLCQ